MVACSLAASVEHAIAYMLPSHQPWLACVGHTRDARQHHACSHLPRHGTLNSVGGALILILPPLPPNNLISSIKGLGQGMQATSGAQQMQAGAGSSSRGDSSSAYLSAQESTSLGTSPAAQTIGLAEQVNPHMCESYALHNCYDRWPATFSARKSAAYTEYCCAYACM